MKIVEFFGHHAIRILQLIILMKWALFYSNVEHNPLLLLLYFLIRLSSFQETLYNLSIYAVPHEWWRPIQPHWKALSRGVTYSCHEIVSFYFQFFFPWISPLIFYQPRHGFVCFFSSDRYWVVLLMVILPWIQIQLLSSKMLF